MASLVGVESLAVGADFVDYLQYMGQREPQSIRLPSADVVEPPAKPNVRLLPRFHEALLRRGFSESDARAIMAGNALRYLKQYLPDAGRRSYLRLTGGL
jgi:microsomal dipeptidase-like Zn-dependent dipeptidase